MSKSYAIAEATHAWTAILDRLESDLSAAEALMTGEGADTPAPWEPPSTTPVLPESLIARVGDLLTRQVDMVRHLEEMRLRAHQQLRLLSLDATKGLNGGPHFIDQRT